ncbi:uncharacterized protein LOC120633872 [Pararge aegeria]|uniref:Jg10808 protein n=1 Tax=Pararge aegeria aegeria TaxID=348720 RepID=A0A8S4RE92_9NEOP|nr:uncharacterized protein LOC120633872 [Pararge aegeria]CAH2233526.1 jg10808 [Pararge aegeria aegeria]
MNWLPLLCTVLAFISFIESRSSKKTKNTKKYLTRAEYFETILKYAHRMDSLLKITCEDNKDWLTETYTNNGYMISYNLDGLNEATLDVKIQNRVLFTIIEQTNNLDPFVDVRMLPMMVDVKRAEWYVVNRMLKVVVPFSVRLTETMPKTCEFDDSDFVVPETIEVFGP